MTGEQLIKTWNRVATWRDNGVEAKWGRDRSGAPRLLIKPSSCEAFYMLSATDLELMAKGLDRGETLAKAAACVFAVADIFHI